MNQLETQPAAPLTAHEREALTAHESVIEPNLRAFVMVGKALAAIRDGGLYREYGTFEDYCELRWDLGRAYAYRKMAAARVVDELSTIVDTLPHNEAQVQPLTQLDTAERRVAAWQRVIESTNGARITAALVEQTVAALQQEWSARETPKAPKTTYGVADWQALSIEERSVIIEMAPLTKDTGFNRTNDNIEWASWSWNPVTGCEHGCDYCYARDIAARFYPQGFVPTFLPERLHAPRHMRVPASAAQNVGDKNVFVCSMADLFGKWVPQDWIDAVFAEVTGAPAWNFLFLTKFPQRLAELRWPANAWCGTTVDRQARVATAERAFRGVEAGIKWLSCEPLLEPLRFSSLAMFDWVVIGASSRSSETPEFQPPWEWVEDLIRQAREAGCKVYLKPNLTSRPREYPEG